MLGWFDVFASTRPGISRHRSRTVSTIGGMTLRLHLLICRKKSDSAFTCFVSKSNRQGWLDPKRNFAVVKRVRTDVEASEAECNSKGVAKYTETTCDDFAQSPNGVWYPTTVKTTGTIWIKQTNPMIVEPLDQHWRFQVESQEELSSELFDIKAAQKRLP